MQTTLDPIASAAKADKIKRFKSLYSFLNRVMFEKAYNALNKKATPGIDNVTWKEYGKNLEQNLIDLETRLKEKRYHARFAKRVQIPKGNGKFRPLGMLVIEDKIVQWVVREILQALFEPLFRDCSYGYRPERSPRQAADVLWEKLMRKCSWVVEADIKSFFDTIDHDKLIAMIEKRVHDQALTRLIRKWLKAGVVLESGEVIHPNEGTPQGSIISPILANIFLHYVLDTWFESNWVRKGNGYAFMVRYADDFVAGFQYQKHAQNFLTLLKERFKQFNLELAEKKTRLLMFNRFDKPNSGTFTFLGFTYERIVSRKGNDSISMKTSRKKMHQKINEFYAWCKKNRNKRVRWIMEMVKAKFNGFNNYYNVYGNAKAIDELRRQYTNILYKWLNRRSQRKSYNWTGFREMLNYFNVFSLRTINNNGYQVSFLSFLF